MLTRWSSSGKILLDMLNQEMPAVKELAEKVRTVSFIKRAHQEEISELKLQVAALQNQITDSHSASTKIKILRLFLVFAGMGLFIAPRSLAFATAVIGIAAQIPIGNRVAETNSPLQLLSACKIPLGKKMLHTPRNSAWKSCSGGSEWSVALRESSETILYSSNLPARFLWISFKHVSSVQFSSCLEQQF